MGSSFWFNTINLEWSIIYMWGCQVIIFKKNHFLREDFFKLTNSVDPDELAHDATFHLGLHCL